MTVISKFLLTGLGGIGVVTATGYGVYYDANNKKIEKFKKNEDVKTESIDKDIDKNRTKEEISEQQDNKTGKQESPIQEKEQEVHEKLEESDSGPVSISKQQDDEIHVQQQDQEKIVLSGEQGGDSQVENDESSPGQLENSHTESETDIQVSGSTSEEEATTFKFSEKSSETEVKEPLEDGIKEQTNSNSGVSGS